MVAKARIEPPEALYEVQNGNRWLTTTEYLFRSWTGERRIDGKPYHGPVYFLGSDRISR